MTQTKRRVVKTTGSGAFAGLIIGGSIGLLFGPGGVILGGLIGAILGDEYEKKQLEEEQHNPH
ncbi:MULTISPECIES: hypothetical protein [Thermococcus]|uniref:hypothetical protein n=1 Tax=Thermococcus TaxID=2263 RepID=UPI00064ECFB1|nr:MULTISPECIES: hypothetical protein [Thermococcus]NJE04204.1 hypothetical protein [Thermococcus sp. MV11]